MRLSHVNTNFIDVNARDFVSASVGVGSSEREGLGEG